VTPYSVTPSPIWTPSEAASLDWFPGGVSDGCDRQRFQVRSSWRGYGYGYGYDYTPAKPEPPPDRPASPNGAAAPEAPPVPSAGS